MLAKLFREASLWCEGRSPLTRTLLTSAADDLDAGGITRRVMAGSELDRASTVPGLRFAAAVHRLVLEGRAPSLARHYPSVGGTPDLTTLWPVAQPVLHEHETDLRELIRSTSVQTNEPGRSAPLYGGLLVASQRAAEAAGRSTPFPLRLLEIGSSGGLNLRPHLVGYELSDAMVLGDPASPLRFDPQWTGLPDADLTAVPEFHSRAACDLRPVDVATKEGRLHLSSFMWADQLDRWDRLQAAIDLAVTDPVPIDRAGGADWLADQLAVPHHDVLTVVWHSVLWRYVSPSEQARGRATLAAAAARATVDNPLALLVFEPRTDHFDLLLKLWPAGLSLHLGTGSGHGIPFQWTEQPWGH